MPKYDPPSYRIYLRNSIDCNRKHILVEGKDDKYLVEKICESDSTTANIIVDSAEQLIKEDGLDESLGNREKVQRIASSINGKEYDHGFVGFVDREFDHFEYDNAELQDLIESHQIIQRLVLSRGHSIENYIFDVSILHETLESLSTMAHASQAISLFKKAFPFALRKACLIGLTAKKSEVLSKVKSTIEHDLLEVNLNGKVDFDFEGWIIKLKSRDVTDDKAEDLRTHYSAYDTQVSRASESLVRWICHGHIGFDFLRALYERCVITTCPSSYNQTKKLSGISWVAKDKMLRCFINDWVKKFLKNEHGYEYPKAIFELLSVTS